MAPFSKNNSSREPVGLDVDSGYVAAVQASGGRIAAGASMDLPDGLVVEGEVADVDGLADALKEFFKQNGLPRSVRLGVANQQVAVRELELPRIDDEADLAAAIRFKAEEAVPMPLAEAVLDHQVIGHGTNFEGTATTQVMVVAARQGMVERLADAARAAGLRPQGIDLNAFALVRLLADPSAPQEQARVYCHLAGVANLAVAVGSTCLFTRTLSVVPAAEPELAAAQLAEEIQPSIDYYLGQPGAKLVGDVVLSGPGAAAGGLADALSPLLGLPVTVANPLGTLNRVGLPPGEDPQRHTIAAGLALGAAS
jgi:type IV pilus assembly protein PilM